MRRNLCIKIIITVSSVASVAFFIYAAIRAFQLAGYADSYLYYWYSNIHIYGAGTEVLIEYWRNRYVEHIRFSVGFVVASVLIAITILYIWLQPRLSPQLSNAEIEAIRLKQLSKREHKASVKFQRLEAKKREEKANLEAKLRAIDEKLNKF